MSNLNDMVKTLRQETGAPLLQCRDALQATNCDMEAAKVYLRESGLQFLEKRKVTSSRPYGILRTMTNINGVINTTETVIYCD